MNHITVAGQLGRDTELRYLPDGTPVASFSVADSQGRDKPPMWWRCSLFGKRAESLKSYLTKGQAVTVVGSVTEREYTNQQGVPSKSMDVRVTDIALQGGAKAASSSPASQPAAATTATSQPADLEADDIPF